jgi:hypothetical protein
MRYNGIERPCFVPGSLPRIRREAQMIVTHGTAFLCRFDDLGPKLSGNKHNALSHHPFKALVTRGIACRQSLLHVIKAPLQFNTTSKGTLGEVRRLFFPLLNDFTNGSDGFRFAMWHVIRVVSPSASRCTKSFVCLFRSFYLVSLCRHCIKTSKPVLKGW